MIKFIIVEDDEKWIDEYEKIINKVFFKSSKEYNIFTFTKYLDQYKK